MDAGSSNVAVPAAAVAAAPTKGDSRPASSVDGAKPQVETPEHRRPHQHPKRSNSRGASRGGHRGNRGGRHGKKRDMGRSEWTKNPVDKRQRRDDEQAAKRQRLDDGKEELPIYATKFSDDVLASEERRPKKKVAVLIGYAGTGYKGMQLAPDQKTIEGDLFQAFVAAGAISKANADDPKKSSFVRCARTDKGVHAAGNVISLKLIVEDEDIVTKINDNLTPQIRIWGFEATNKAFSAYQMVDSRIYEYLIPSHSFLPPHPTSFLGRKCDEWAEKKGEVEEYRKRQEEVSGYWEKIDEEIIHPILAEYDEEIQSLLKKALWLKGEDSGKDNKEIGADTLEKPPQDGETEAPDEAKAETEEGESSESRRQRNAMLADASKRLRKAYISAKRAYRIPEARLNRLQEVLNTFVGTRNFHNYTIQKPYRDPSAKRLIKSFTLNKTPILIDGTEWLSLKVHGQSFMMHQIRKMVGMAALVVRCGCDPKRMAESMGPEDISIPKAPSLGLLLERPIFDNYNKSAKDRFGREKLDFDKFKPEMDKFKQEQIYERMYRDEEAENVFGNFFTHVDNFPSEAFLFVTAGGIEATKTKLDHGLDDDTGVRDRDIEAALAHKDAMADLEDGDSDADEPARDNHGDEG